MSKFTIGILVAAIMALTIAPAHAAGCRPYAKITNQWIDGRRVHVQWSLAHSAGLNELATVFIRYTVDFTTRGGMKGSEREIVRETIRGAGAVVTKRFRAMTSEPVERITGIKIRKITCSH